MVLEATCPRCPSAAEESGGGYACAQHGPITPLWRPLKADYESFAEVVRRAGGVPTYLPWPMSPGWSIADFGCVADDRHALATVTTTSGTSDLDGPVQITVVAEDPGVGLGARCAGADYVDPGEQVGRGPHDVQLRVAGRPVRMWSVDGGDGEPLERAVFAGEALARWLWLVVRPAAAALLLRDEWIFADVSEFGPEAVEMPFGGPPSDP